MNPKRNEEVDNSPFKNCDLRKIFIFIPIRPLKTMARDEQPLEMKALETRGGMLSCLC